jgi:hypothetical protein
MVRVKLQGFNAIDRRTAGARAVLAFKRDDQEVRIIVELCERAKRAGSADLSLSWSAGELSRKLLQIRGVGDRTRLVGGAPTPREF